VRVGGFVGRRVTPALKVIGIAVGIAVLVVIVGVVVSVVFFVWRDHEQQVHNEGGGKRGGQGYAQIQKGAGAASVERLLGKPTSTHWYEDGRGRELFCWEYGGISDFGNESSAIIDYCFAHGRLVRKAVISAAGRVGG
jgi:hypothetical protein